MILVGLAGLVAGAAIGILFAPKKGSKTRKNLKKSFRKVAETVDAEFGDTVEGIKHFLRKDGRKVETPEAQTTES